MAVVLTLFFALFAALNIYLRAADRKKWENEKKRMEEEVEALKVRMEEDSRHVGEVGRQLEQAGRAMEEMRESQQSAGEKIQELLQERKAFLSAAARIHLYIQLVLEQCGEEPVRRQCGVILSECQGMLEKNKIIQ